MTEEQWLPVVGHPRYQVSDQGRIKGVYGRLLKADRGNQVTLDTSRCLVHHVVLEAFVGPRPEGRVGRHKDDDRTNNALANLAWGTLSENQHDAVRNGKHPQASKTCCVNGHQFTPENTYMDGNRRQCRQCRRDRLKGT